MNNISAGNWFYKNGAVLTNVPTERPSYVWEDKEQEFIWYGGYIVAESIFNKEDGNLLAYSKHMSNVVELLLSVADSCKEKPFDYNTYIQLKIASTFSIGYRFSPYYILPEIQKPFPKLIAQYSTPQHHSHFAFNHV